MAPGQILGLLICNPASIPFELLTQRHSGGLEGIATLGRQPGGCCESAVRLERRCRRSPSFCLGRSSRSHCSAPVLLGHGDLLPWIWRRFCIEGRVK